MGSKFAGDDDVISDINITPFVDIILVVLIIFMVTTTQIVKSAIQVDLPDAANAEKPDVSSLGITLKADGTLLVDGNSVSADQLKQRVTEARDEDEDLVCLVAADKGVAWGRIVWLLDTLKSLGQAKYAFNIDKTELVGPDPASFGEGAGELPESN